MRIDKWLWAVRLFKTRTQATEACRKGRIILNGSPVKASGTYQIGDIVEIKYPPIVRKFQILAEAEKRVSAKTAVGLVLETTPEKDLDLLKRIKRDPVMMIAGYREKGTGRPTKKERRQLQNLNPPMKE